MKNAKLKLLAAACALLCPYANANTNTNTKLKYGIELDAVPYLLGGYYVSALVAINNFQLRYVTTKYETPSFYLKNGFKDDNVEVKAFILDYYFDNSLKGFWVGSGIEKWQGKVTESSSGVEKGYDTNLFTIGGGYSYYLNDYFYLNPWIGLHIPVSGDDKVSFTNNTFDINTTAEISLKLGFKY
ncbi:hypothetical protein [Vibrio hangzhouensis]|uniref:Outer membrane protein beta-barrel domain-containing protein n=1 Tax=Vibrio hangzhouensis TaxID=462991 RepID=A0A1H5RN38_9VIBR|nr:hypothetical protein [Vibrio hangzhouensis]SEF39735.1 hypothetical protein SAMN04488244_10136 [Vibrio hangzhouensis]